MKSREDVIKGLECCLASKYPPCGECGYDGDMCYNDPWSCRLSLMADTLALLKTQAPRVLTYDEARNHAMQTMNPDSIKPLFIEFRVKQDDEEEQRPPWRGGYNQRLMLAPPCDRYNVEFRFWTDRPTKEQMEATAWK